MIEMILQIVLAIIALGEPIFFYSIYRSKKKAEVTDANSENSLKLIELQEKYIDIIDEKDKKIHELQESNNNLSSELIYYKTTHCELMSCPNRVPPMKSTFLKDEGV